MIRTIIKRELIDYLKSLKFTIGMVVTIVLVVISTIISEKDYVQRVRDYSAAQTEMKGDGFNIELFRPPEVLSTIVQGIDRMIGNRIEFSYTQLPGRTSGYMGAGASQQHRYLGGFSAVDFAFIVRIVMSLFVIFLTYNVVSQEKVSGTLRLLCTNPVPRYVMIIGKFIGEVIIVLIVLLTATLVALIILLLSPIISFNSSDWIRIGLMIATSALYLLSFCTLSLLVSIMINRPSIALTVLLQMWIILIIIYPNVAILVADSYYPLSSLEEMDQRLESAWQPYKDEMDKINKEFVQQVQTGEFVRGNLQIKEIEMSAKHAEINYQVEKEYADQLSHQVRFAQAIGVLSPGNLFDQTQLRYARTGIDQFERFMDAVLRQWRADVDLSKRRALDVKLYRTEKLPLFTVTPPRIDEDVSASAVISGILFLLCCIPFAAAFTMFIRKDVR